MQRLRHEILSGIAAASLLGAAGTARADDHRFKPEVNRHFAEDGRGDTSDYRQSVIRVEQVGRTPERHRPERPYTEQSAAPLPIKAEIRARFSEDADLKKMPSVAAAPADDSRTAEQRRADRERVMSQLPMKTEISLRIEDNRADEGGASAPGVQGQQKSSANRAMLDRLPIKTEVRMRMGSGGEEEK